MDLALSEEQEAVRKLAEDFVAREVAPHVVDWDRAEDVDRSIVRKLGDVGFLGLTVPEEYGGSGGDHLSYCLVTEELGRGDSSVRGIVSVSLGLVAKTVAAWGSEEQKRAWLPRLTSGEAIGCFGLTEPGTGSDAGNLATRAVRDGGDYVVNGAKTFITNGTWADVVLLFARTGEAPGHRGVSAFLVPADTPRPHPPHHPRQARPARPGHRRTGPRRRPDTRVSPPRPRGQGVLDRHVRPGQRADVGRGGLCRHRPGGAGRGRAVRGRARAVRQGHRLTTSSSRNCSATSPWTWTPPGC